MNHKKREAIFKNYPLKEDLSDLFDVIGNAYKEHSLIIDDLTRFVNEVSAQR